MSCRVGAESRTHAPCKSSKYSEVLSPPCQAPQLSLLVSWLSVHPVYLFKGPILVLLILCLFFHFIHFGHTFNNFFQSTDLGFKFLHFYSFEVSLSYLRSCLFLTVVIYININFLLWTVLIVFHRIWYALFSFSFVPRNVLFPS